METYPSPKLDLVSNSWHFLEVWIEPMQSPPYILLLFGDESGKCHIVDLAEQYKSVNHCDTYTDAQMWLLEDEYGPLEGRL